MLVKKVAKIAIFCFTLYITLSFKYTCYKKVAKIAAFCSTLHITLYFCIIVMKSWASLPHLLQTVYAFKKGGQNCHILIPTVYHTVFQYTCYKKVANYYKRWPELPHFVLHYIQHCIFGIIVIKRWASLLHLFQTRYTCYKKVARIAAICYD